MSDDTIISSILVVDDDSRIRKLLEDYLGIEGFLVRSAAHGNGMRQQMEDGDFDLVLLDIGLPGEDGLTLARELRRVSTVGIIMLTGKADVIDRIVGIEVGADDYIAKPFHLREVLARVKAVLRRAHDNGKSNIANPEEELLENGTAFGQWQFFPARRSLIGLDGCEVALTSGEFDMLAALLRNPGRVLTRDQLMDITHGSNWAAVDRTIDAQIARLRKKIEPDVANPSLIKSVRGVGYVFSAKTRRIQG